MRKIQSRFTPPLWLGIAVLLLVITPWIAYAQQEKRIEHRLLEEAKSAATVDQYTQVIKHIEAEVVGNQNHAAKQYLKKLLAWVYNRRGEAYARLAATESVTGKQPSAQEHDDQALKDFEESLKLDPTRWKSLHNRAVCYALAGRLENAIRDLTSVIKQRPDYVNAWFNRAEIHYELGHFAEAVSDYSEAIRLQPQDAGFHTGRGHAYFQLRELAAAAADYDQAIQLAPGSAENYANRGDTYRALGKWENAAKDFRRAVELDSQFGRGYQSAAWLMATCPDPQYRDSTLAVQAAEKAVQLDSHQDYVYLDTLAAAYANANQFAEAQKTLRRAIPLTPEQHRATLQHRLKLYQAGQPYRQTIGPKAVRQARLPQRLTTAPSRAR